MDFPPPSEFQKSQDQKLKVVVTGAAGFIGSHMAERLNKFGYEVYGIDNFSGYYDAGLKYQNAANLKKQGIKVIPLDLCFDTLSDSLPTEISYIFHFAAQPGIASTSTYEQYCNNNILATRRIIDFAEECSNLKMFINIATSSIYGRNATGNENQLPQPISNYGVTKLAAEQMVLSRARQGSIKACSMRLYSVYGPRERPDKLFTRLIDSAINNQTFPLYEGSLSHLRSFTFIDDIVDGIMKTIGKESICNQEIFNIGNELEQTTQQAIRIVEELLQITIKYELLSPRNGDQKRTSANIEKAKRLLGYEPRTLLNEGVQKQIEWYREMNNRKLFCI